jgi:vitamin B12 transporter
MVRKIYQSTLCISILCTLRLSGDGGLTDSMPLIELEPYVVVATRTPLLLERVSPSVEYIDSDVITFWQDNSLVDTLNRQTGVSLIANGAEGSQASLFIRGSESNHTSLFLDGRQLNRGFGNQFAIESLAVANLESVQLQKGASSVNYGSSGIGGVVDLRSTSGLGIAANEYKLSQTFGSNQYRDTQVSTLIGDEVYGFSLSAGVLASENERPNDAYQRDSAQARFDYKLTDQLVFELLGHYIAADKEIPGSSVAPTLNRDQFTINWLISPGLKYESDSLTVHLFYSRSESNLDNYNAGAQNDIIVQSDELHLQADYTLSERVLFSSGLTYRSEEAFNTAIPYFERFNQTGVYGQVIWQTFESLELRGGLRYDRYSDYDNATTGSFEGLYAFDEAQLTVFTKIATSYAPPSAVDFAFDFDASTPLNAEESHSYEIGIRQNLLEGSMQYSVVFFRNEIDELLSFDPNTFDTFNIQEATTQGLEFSLAYQIAEYLELSFGYTYLHAVADQLNDPRTVFPSPVDPAKDVPLARRARHQLNFGATYRPNEKLSLGLNASGYFRRQDIDPISFAQGTAEDYFVVGVLVGWEVTDDWSVFTRVENLLDQDYAPAAGFPALGRTAYVGAKLSF